VANYTGGNSNGAQHKSPGKTGKKNRQMRALDRLKKDTKPSYETRHYIKTLEAKLNIA
jgi:hypothetical protein